jgi:hypothetical protein
MRHEADAQPPRGSELFELPSWPERHHDLRATGPDYRSHALVGYQAGWDRADGYRRAAEILADHLLAHRHDLDAVVFPFAACWRHHVEVQLKGVLVDLQRLLDVPVVEHHHHDVLQLWNEVRPLLVKAHPGEERRDRAVVGRLLHQLAELDPLGEGFRYGKRRDGSATLAGVDRLDVRAFHEAMQAVASYLAAVMDKTAYDLDLKAEYEQEMEHEMPDEY